MVFGIIGVIDVSAQIDGNHPGNGCLRFANIGPNGLVEKFEKEAIHADFFRPALFPERFRFILREKVPGYQVFS